MSKKKPYVPTSPINLSNIVYKAIAAQGDTALTMAVIATNPFRSFHSLFVPLSSVPTMLERINKEVGLQIYHPLEIHDWRKKVSWGSWSDRAITPTIILEDAEERYDTHLKNVTA